MEFFAVAKNSFHFNGPSLDLDFSLDLLLDLSSEILIQNDKHENLTFKLEIDDVLSYQFVILYILILKSFIIDQFSST